VATDKTRPDLDDATAEALGKLAEALEVVEHARGLLYGFHRLTGTADLTLQESIELLRKAGHAALADDLDRELVGRNVIADRWTFQIVEDYDAGYWASFRALEARARAELADGAAHVHEARMKQRERTRGHAAHGAGPGLPDDDGGPGGGTLVP
jgi:hypothetical protein